MNNDNENLHNSSLWDRFTIDENLTAEQKTQFQQYTVLLQQWSQKINLTTVTSEKGIINTHFRDSLALRTFLMPKSGEVLCDIGTGAGLPGIPLAIVYPECTVILIEVTQKKIAFLREVIAQLNLDNVKICDLDWRTFLRASPYDCVDFFLSRASIKPSELIRVFKSTSSYREAMMIYWAAEKWSAPAIVTPYINRVESYIIGTKRRQLIFMSN